MLPNDNANRPTDLEQETKDHIETLLLIYKFVDKPEELFPDSTLKDLFKPVPKGQTLLKETLANMKDQISRDHPHLFKKVAAKDTQYQLTLTILKTMAETTISDINDIEAERKIYQHNPPLAYRLLVSITKIDVNKDKLYDQLRNNLVEQGILLKNITDKKSDERPHSPAKNSR